MRLTHKKIRWCLAFGCLVLLLFAFAGTAGAADPQLTVSRSVSIEKQYQGFTDPLEFHVRVYDADLSSALPVTLRIGTETISENMTQDRAALTFSVAQLNGLLPGSYTIYLETEGNGNNAPYQTTAGTVRVQKRTPRFRGSLDITASPGRIGEHTLTLQVEDAIVDANNPLTLLLTLQDLSTVTVLREVPGFQVEQQITSLTEEVTFTLPASVLDGLSVGSYAPRITTAGNAYTAATPQQVGLITVQRDGGTAYTAVPTATPAPGNEQNTPRPTTPPVNDGSIYPTAYASNPGPLEGPEATRAVETPVPVTPEPAPTEPPSLDLGDGLTLSLEQLQETDRVEGMVPVQLPEKIGGTSVSLPMSLLEALEDPVLLQTSYGSYAISAALVEAIPDLAERLDAMDLTVAEISLSVTIQPVVPTVSMLADLTESLSQAQLLGLPVDFSLALAGPQGESLSFVPTTFTTPVRRYLPLDTEGEEAPEDSWAAFRYNPLTGALEPVAQHLVYLEGQWTVAIDSYSNSIYLLTRREVVLADVAQDDLAYPYISRAVSKALMDTTEEDLFEPGEPISRAEFIQMFTNILYMPETNAPHPYTDVSSDNDFDEAIGRAYAAGWLSQLAPGDTLDPYQCITREESLGVLLAILRQYNAIGEPAATEDLTRLYADYWDLAPQYMSALSFVQSTGILPELADGTLSPTTCVTRAQAAEILIKTLVQVGYLDE